MGQITVSEAAGFTYAVIVSLLIIVAALVAGVTLTREPQEADEVRRDTSAVGGRDGARHQGPVDDRPRVA